MSLNEYIFTCETLVKVFNNVYSFKDFRHPLYLVREFIFICYFVVGTMPASVSEL